MANHLSQVTTTRVIATEKPSLSNPKVLVLEPGVTAAAGEVSWVCSAFLGSTVSFPSGQLSSRTF